MREVVGGSTDASGKAAGGMSLGYSISGVAVGDGAVPLLDPVSRLVSVVHGTQAEVSCCVGGRV